MTTEGITSQRRSSRRTLIEEINHIADIFSHRNRLYMPNLPDRILWLELAVKDLFEVIRKKKSPLAHQLAVARVFARIVAVDEHFRAGNKHLPFVKLLCQKYPKNGCSYCKQKPCQCPPDRNNSSELDASTLSEQKLWGLHEWQSHLAAIYGEVNKDAHWSMMSSHLFSEVVELSAIHYRFLHKLEKDELIFEYATELADIFAWTCGVATRKKIFIGPAVEMVYGNGCGGCGYLECDCGIHQYDFLNINAFEKKFLEFGSADSVPASELSS